MTIQIDEKVLLVSVNQLYRDGMNALETYEVSRGVWILYSNRKL